MATFNICTASDSYKFQHWNMYPTGTEKVYSYFESRTGAKYDNTVFFGLQYLLKQNFLGQVVTEEKILQAKDRIEKHLGPGSFNEAGWRYILEKYDGKLPVKISAVQEGTPVPVNNVLMTVENTDPKCYWLTNYLETVLTHVWSSSTVATASREMKKVMKQYLDWTSENPDAINFMLHDFGFRGVSSFESAAIEGAGHLVNFMGTDTFAGIECAMDYYNTDVCAYSVPATEHSIMTAQGRDGEADLLGDLLDKYPTGILSVVIDSYNYRDFIDMAADRYKDKILARDGKVVFRPDSGNPREVSMDVCVRLATRFGSTQNKKVGGFGVLNPKVGLLWGDGVGPEGIKSILHTMFENGWSAENIVFGMGGGLLQKINRDTQRFAFKSSYQERNGVGYDIYKDPIDGSKKSKRGRLMLMENNIGFKTMREGTNSPSDGENRLETVFLNGDLVRDMSFDEVRANAAV